MPDLLESYRKTKDFLICIDSDGCAMDTMDCKHILCFGPCLIPVWGLEPWREQVLSRWNDINLYTSTRGINRFKGLAMILTEIDREKKTVPGIDEFSRWVEEAVELSMPGVQAQWERTGLEIFRQAYEWSDQVNRKIRDLPEDEKKVFSGVCDAVQKAHEFADVAIVSSANRQAVLEEWGRHNLLDYVDVAASQDTGTKADCIRLLMEHGYERDHVLMVGDAPGDYDAARKNRVLFYPILVRKEEESWKRFVWEGLVRMRQGSYAGSYQQQVVEQFENNLTIS